MRQPIAILDSGVGGLTVTKEVMRQLPQEKLLYFGDTARTPYGPRSSEEVIQFTHQIVDYLLQYDPKMIVIACNTATAVALDSVRAQVHIPVVGVIHPGARAAIKVTKNYLVGVIGTEGTIRSRAYEQSLKQLCPQLSVRSLACPEFVPIVEKGLFTDKATLPVIANALTDFKQFPMDCLILGCTHYPFLSEMISQVMGPDIILISSAEETAREISTILSDRNMLAETDCVPDHQFFCSGDPALFKEIAELWLNEQIKVTPAMCQVPHIV